MDRLLLQQPEIHAKLVVIAIVVAGLCLVALWAGLSKRHWFLRIAAIYASILALYPIRVYAPMVVLSLMLPHVAIWPRGIRNLLAWRKRHEGASGSPTAQSCFQYRLVDLLLATALVGAVVALVSALSRNGGLRDWPLMLFSELLYITGGGDGVWPNIFLGFVEVCAVMAIVLLLVRASAKPQADTASSRRATLARWTARATLIALGLATFVPLSMLYWFMLQGPEALSEQRPSSNSYPRLLAAAEESVALNPGELSVAELRCQPRGAAVATQMERLHQETMLLVAEPGFVTVDLNLVFPSDYIESRDAGRDHLMSLARMWSAESKRAHEAKQFDEAAAYGIACLQLGHTLSHGGLETDSLYGTWIERIGLSALSEIRADVSESQAHKLLTRLQQVEKTREPFAVTFAREMTWRRQQYVCVSRLEFAMNQLTERSFETADVSLLGGVDSDGAFLNRVFDRRDAFFRLFKSDLAIRLYQQDHGRLPESLDELVSDYLAAVPVDPYAEGRFVYRRQDGSFLLYSVGPDGRDDGGQFGIWQDFRDASPIDLDLDINLRGRLQYEASLSGSKPEPSQNP